ncbi:hypothetical protein DOY81_007757 [Sarcophaga bullata]|nr:hypothetical protein DOY81_007757 [Sarcophaga bullata]
MTGSFSVKLKSKNGQYIVKELTNKTTVADLKNRVSQITHIRDSQMNILLGFPPRPLDLAVSNGKRTLEECGITSGETLIVEEKIEELHDPSLEDDEALARRLQAEEEEEQLREVVAAATAAETPDHANAPPPGSSGNFNGILLKKVVPADNSCLFTSVRFVLNGKVDNDGSEMMRHIIAQEVAANPQEYNDAVLGKSNSEYCAWIQKPDSWGGAIEVAILSNYYGIEIDVVDIQNAIINRFGEDKNYGLRVFLLFDGIHYDPLYMETEGGGAPATIFPVEEMGVYQQAEQLAKEAKSSRQFTNVDKFSLRCLQCDVMLVGQLQATQHAKATGHANFGEI